MELLRKHKVRPILFLSLALLCAFTILPHAAFGQRIAILTPDASDDTARFADLLVERLGSERIKTIDVSLAQTAYAATRPSTPFNLTTDESRRIGQALGCEFFVLVRSATLRRSSSQRTEYYEAFAAIYLVSSHSGRLVFWKNQRFEGFRPDTAAKLLDESVPSLANEIAERTRTAQRNELNEPPPPAMEEPPDSASASARNFRAPVPYRRIKPEYTVDAALYDIVATVDIVVDTDAAGKISRTEIVRWAGYDLDESVDKAVRSMNWRPAERNGRSIAMRFLLRYNFRKLEKEAADRK